jgi:hypothetical protein
LSQETLRDLVHLLKLDQHPSTSVLWSIERERSARLTDLEGLGREIWAGEDAQAYVSSLRDEWDR